MKSESSFCLKNKSLNHPTPIFSICSNLHGFARFSLICFPRQHCLQRAGERTERKRRKKKELETKQQTQNKQTIKSKKEEIQEMKMTVASKRKVRCECEHTKHPMIQNTFAISPFSNMSLDTNNIESPGILNFSHVTNAFLCFLGQPRRVQIHAICHNTNLRCKPRPQHTFLDRLEGNPRWMFDKQATRENHTIRRVLVLQPQTAPGNNPRSKVPKHMWPLGWHVCMFFVTWLNLNGGHILRASKWVREEDLFFNLAESIFGLRFIEKQIAGSPPQTNLAEFKNESSSWINF